MADLVTQITAERDEARAVATAAIEECVTLVKERNRLARRIHNQRRALRDNWEIVESRRKWLGSDSARKGWELQRNMRLNAEAERDAMKAIVCDFIEAFKSRENYASGEPQFTLADWFLDELAPVFHDAVELVGSCAPGRAALQSTQEPKK